MVVVTSLYFERTPAIARALLVKWLMLEMSEMINTSGGTLTILFRLDRDIMKDVPSGAHICFGLKKRVESIASGFVTTASASAKASECSKMVMPASCTGWRPCRAQESVSTKWLIPKERNRGHRIASDPDGRAESGSLGSILAALHESSVVSQERSADEARHRYPASPAKSVSSCLPGAPYCSSDHAGDV
jgi:hypothetical protein